MQVLLGSRGLKAKTGDVLHANGAPFVTVDILDYSDTGVNLFVGPDNIAEVRSIALELLAAAQKVIDFELQNR